MPRERKRLVWSIPDEIIPGTVQMHVIGNRELYIENFQSILEYSDTCIRLQTKYGRLRIEGKQLCIQYYNRDDMKICGYIHNICLK